MSAPSSGTLNEVLGIFLGHLDVLSLKPEVMSIFKMLVILEIAILGSHWAMSGNEQVGKLFKRILAVGFFSYVIKHYPDILGQVMGGFFYAGKKAGGNHLLNDYFYTPSGIIDVGVALIKPLLVIMSYKVGLFSGWIFGAFTLISIFVILAAFTILAIQVFILRIEFAIVATMGFILIPLGVFKHTSFLAEKMFGAIISFGVKYMVLTFVITLSLPVLFKITLTNIDPNSWYPQIYLMASSITVAMLALHSPGMAAGLLSGAPSLTAGAIAGPAAAVGAGSMIAGGMVAGTAGRIGKSVVSAAAGALGRPLGSTAAKASTEAASTAMNSISNTSNSGSGGGVKSFGSGVMNAGGASSQSPLQAAMSGKSSSPLSVASGGTKTNGTSGNTGKSSEQASVSQCQSENPFKEKAKQSETQATKVANSENDKMNREMDFRSGESNQEQQANHDSPDGQKIAQNGGAGNPNSDLQNQQDRLNQQSLANQNIHARGRSTNRTGFLRAVSNAHTTATSSLSSSSPNGALSAPIIKESE